MSVLSFNTLKKVGAKHSRCMSEITLASELTWIRPGIMNTQNIGTDRGKLDP
jgi:hypothetical protein